MDHEALRDALARAGITTEASEAHGLLCGALCVRESFDAREWLGELAAGRGAAAQEPDAALHRLPAEVLDSLRSADFGFEPLLPADETPLIERVAALAAWCDGFLYGIATGAPALARAEGGELGEFLADLADIARAELEPGRAAAEGEADYMELVEFVRAGAQLSFDELARAGADAAG